MINSRDTIKKILFCLLLSLSSTNFAATHQPLAVDQAFQLQAHLQHRSLYLHWQIAPTYQLYKKSITVKPFEKSGIQLAAIKLPRRHSQSRCHPWAPSSLPADTNGKPPDHSLSKW